MKVWGLLSCDLSCSFVKYRHCNYFAGTWSQLVDFAEVQFTHRYITHTQLDSSPLVLPTLCQSSESVDVDYTIKGKFHPQVLFSLLDTINLHCSVHCSTYFVIKCCDLLIRCPHSLSTSLLLQLMLSCISQTDSKKSPQIRNELVALGWLCVGGESRSIKKKWVMLFS